MVVFLVSDLLHSQSSLTLVGLALGSSILFGFYGDSLDFRTSVGMRDHIENVVASTEEKRRTDANASVRRTISTCIFPIELHSENS